MKANLPPASTLPPTLDKPAQRTGTSVTKNATMSHAVWKVAWSNPHKPRPEGVPEVILRVEVEMQKGKGAGQCPQEVHECWQEMRPYGYTVYCHIETPPARVLPIASKQKIRRRNLWKRIIVKYPMFAETFYQERVESMPDYYGPFTLGEFADVQFYRTTMGNLAMQKLEVAA